MVIIINDISLIIRNNNNNNKNNWIRNINLEYIYVHMIFFY